MKKAKKKKNFIIKIWSVKTNLSKIIFFSYKKSKNQTKKKCVNKNFLFLWKIIKIKNIKLLKWLFKKRFKWKMKKTSKNQNRKILFFFEK